LNKPKFEWADRLQILAYGETATDFFQDILGMDYSEILITDESALSDFACCGSSCSDYPEALMDRSLPRQELRNRWREWVVKRISARYGIEIPESGMIYLVSLFRQIEAAKNTKMM
jgi:hypothetical protein